MKILYSIQATGNGHISRAHQLYPHLLQYGQVDLMLSGSNASLALDLPVAYKSRGLSLFYSQCGGLSYSKIFKELKVKEVLRDAAQLPVEKYDVVINDFDFVTARACQIKSVPSVQFGHQASFMSDKTPRPDKNSWLGEFILQKYAKATKYVGLHFDRYDDFIFPPVIKTSLLESKPEDHGHITVYLPAYQRNCIENILREVTPKVVHWFLPEIVTPYVDGNIHFFPVSHSHFNESLLYCHGLLTGGGFETPAEALYLGKKLLVNPIHGQYEQQCNAAALKEKGISSLQMLDDTTKHVFFAWVEDTKSNIKQEANCIAETLDYVFGS